MDLNLEGKRVLITGGSSGLGLACAEALAAEGAQVAICSRRAQNLNEAAEVILRNTGASVKTFEANITFELDRKRLLHNIQQQFGNIDIFILSTGHPPTFPLQQTTPDLWETGKSLILDPAIDLCQHILPGMCARRYGRLIFIGSIFGLEPESTSIIQSTYRTGLNAFAKCIATQYAAYGITSNVICPGYFDTPLVRRLAQQYSIQESRSVESVLEDWKCFAPSKRFGKPEDLAAFVCLLSAPQGEFINGTAITIDGGALRRY